MQDDVMRGRIPMLLAGFSIALAVMLVLRVEGRAPRVATRSTVRSIAAYLGSDGGSFLPKAQDNDAWRDLTPQEYEILMKAVAEAGCVDRAKLDPKSGYPCDAWGGHFQVAVRAAREGTLEFRISSSGPDRILGTRDDLKQLGKVPSRQEPSRFVR